MSITTHDVAEIIHTRLGFVPTESLVLACLPAAPGDGLVIRIDLASLLPPADPDPMLARVVGPLRLARTRAVAVAYYTEHPPTVLEPVDHAVDSLLDQVELPRETTVLVDDIPDGPARQDLGSIEPADPTDRAAALAALHRGDGDLQTYLEAVGCAAEGRPVQADALGRVATWIARPAHRDAVIALCAGVRPPTDGLIPGRCDTSQAVEVVMTRLLGADSKPPGPEVAAHARVLTQVVATVPPPYQVPARTVLGLLAWWSGNGPLADRHLSEALTIDPDYRLAWLLRALLAEAIGPGWTRRPD